MSRPRFSAIAVVFFDAAGTLFDLKGSVADVYLHYAQKYGVVPSAHMKQAINQAFRTAFQQAPPPVFSTDDPMKLKHCERIWWFDIVHAVFYRVGMFEGFDDFFDEVFEAFSTSAHWMVFPETIWMLQTLKAKGYELGIISNFDTRLFTILQELGIRQYFDSITISSLAGAAKPASKIFQIALEQHVIDPSEAVHVGDSFAEDVEGALAAGLHPVLLARERVELPPQVPTIQTLSDLLQMLEVE